MKTSMIRGVAAGLVLGLTLLAIVPPGLTQDLTHEYTISPGDVLDISVLGEPELTGPVTVSPDGTIILQMVGQIPAAGLTLTQITDRLTTELRQYIKEPMVTVTVRQAASHRQFVYLLGQVFHPGAYEMQKGWTLAELVAVAGGPTPGASLPQALILRKETTIPVDLKQLIVDGDASANVSLEPGDVVIVPETKNKVVIMGGVAKPGPYLFKDGDRVVDVLSAAGGPTPKAVTNQIGVVREEGKKPTVLPVDLQKFYKDGDKSQNVLLLPGDIVYVPEKGGPDWSAVMSGLTGITYLFLLLK
jgi:polysaccharide biosynthesis/export protein